MPIDKFGRHLHQHQQPKHGDIAKLFLVESISGLQCETLITIVGQGTNANGNVHIWGGPAHYTCNFTSATIVQITLYPAQTVVVVNGVKYMNSQLIGVVLKKGDIVKFNLEKKSAPANLFFEAVVKMPLIVKNGAV